jgi:hypothetical protein
MLADNVDTYVAQPAPPVYSGSTALQGWSAWMGLGIRAGVIAAAYVIPASMLGIFQVGCWIAMTVLVYNDLDRTRMSRGWAFFTFFFGVITLTAYLYTRNSRGFRTAAAPRA